MSFPTGAVSVLLILSLPSIPIAEETSTYDIVLSGKTCKESGTRTIICDFRVGKDLHFTMDDIGGSWTGITFISPTMTATFMPRTAWATAALSSRRGKRIGTIRAAEVRAAR